MGFEDLDFKGFNKVLKHLNGYDRFKVNYSICSAVLSKKAVMRKLFRYA